MPGSGHPVEGGLRAADDGRRIVIPGEAASQGAVFGVLGGYVIGVAGIPPKYLAQGVRVRETTLGDHAPRRRDTKLKNIFPNCGGGKELSCQGVSRTGSNSDRNAGPLPTTACPGHRDHTVGGKPTPPTVPPVQHPGALKGAGRATSYH